MLSLLPIRLLSVGLFLLCTAVIIVLLANATRLMRYAERSVRMKGVLLFVVSGMAIIIVLPILNAMMPHHLVIAGNVPTLLYDMQDIDAKLIDGIAEIRTVGSIPYHSRHVTGTYESSTRRIYVRDDANDMVLRHEIFHDVWYQKLTDAERKEFTNIHMTVSPPTEYGLASVDEDFADAGALYVADMRMLDSPRAKFFDKVYQRLLGYNFTAADSVPKTQYKNVTDLVGG